MSLLGTLRHRLGLGPPPPAAALPRVAPRHVFRWDLDKTYLRTEFDSLRDLARSAIENAADKQAYPGAPALLRALGGEGHRITIVSGSPSQMRQVLAAKLALDGVAFDEFVLKDNLRNILRGRFRALRAQIPYKLPALLASRCATPPAPAETLFGDDAEADAIIYCLYADILAERVGISDLDRRSPPMGFRRFGHRLVPVFNYFQTAVVLYADGVLSARQVLFVALEMLDSRQFELASLANSLQDLLRRGRLEAAVGLRLADEATEAARSGALTGRSDLPPFDEIARIFTDRVRQLGGVRRAVDEGDEVLDYVGLVDEEHDRRRDRRRRGMH